MAAQKEVEEQVKDKEENEEEKGNENDENNEDKPKSDFSGTWVLKKNGDSTDAYYKSEGWGYLIRKAVPSMAMTQVISQNGSKMKMQMLVSVFTKVVADQTNESVIGSGEVIEYKDKEGICCATSKWNDDKTQILSHIYRKDDEKRTYEGVRKFADDSKKKMICTTTNNKGHTLTQYYELQE